MTLALHELTGVMFDDDRKPLPKWRGAPLDDQPMSQRTCLNPKEAVVLSLLPWRQTWSTSEVAKAAGISESWARTYLAALLDMNLVVRERGKSRGRSAGREPDRWRRLRGAADYARGAVQNVANRHG